MAKVIDATKKKVAPMFGGIQVVVFDVNPERADKTAEHHIGLGVGKVHIVETSEEAVNVVCALEPKCALQLVIADGNVIIGGAAALAALQSAAQPTAPVA